MRLDEIDHKILARLTDHGRESFAMLGHHIGLSTAATKRRVDRLRQGGVIRRFTADVEPAALGWTIEAFVEVYCEGRVPPDRMREMVSSIPEVALREGARHHPQSSWRLAYPLIAGSFPTLIRPADNLSRAP